MSLSKVPVLFSLLLLILQGCALKEDVIKQQQITAPKVTIAPKVKIVTPVIAPKHTTSNIKVMKFLTTKNKTITITGDDNILKVTNPEYQDTDIVLYLFGKNCPHCKNEVSQIKALSRKSNIKIIGIHAHKMIGDAALKAYTKKIGYNFDILSFKNDIEIIRYLKKAGIWYGGTPTHLLIDRSGNVTDVSITELLNR